MCNISFNVDHYKHSQEEYSQRKPNMDTYARNCWFFVAEGHLSEGLPDGTVVNTSHLYIIPVETEGEGGARSVT